MKRKLVLLLIPAALLVFTVSCGDEAAAEEEHSETSEVDSSQHTAADSVDVNYFFNVNNVIVNPAGSRGRSLVALSVTLDMNSAGDVAMLEGKDLILRDLIITTVSSKSVRELSAVGMKDSLKTELQASINENLSPLEVRKVYFTKFIIQ